LQLSECALTIVAKGVKGEYELVIIYPSHFLIDNFPVVIKHPVTRRFTCFYASECKDGMLREGSPTGPPLPPFCSRGTTERSTPLNPILVNWAAIIRLRRLICQNPMWGSALASRVIQVLQRVVTLHAAVLWDPQQSSKEQFIVNVPGSGPQTMQDWPYFHTSPQPNLGTKTDMSNTALERAFELLEEGRCPLHLSSHNTSLPAFFVL